MFKLLLLHSIWRFYHFCQLLCIRKKEIWYSLFKVTPLKPSVLGLVSGTTVYFDWAEENTTSGSNSVEYYTTKKVCNLLKQEEIRHSRKHFKCTWTCLCLFSVEQTHCSAAPPCYCPEITTFNTKPTIHCRHTKCFKWIWMTRVNQVSSLHFKKNINWWWNELQRCLKSYKYLPCVCNELSFFRKYFFFIMTATSRISRVKTMGMMI